MDDPSHALLLKQWQVETAMALSPSQTLTDPPHSFHCNFWALLVSKNWPKSSLEDPAKSCCRAVSRMGAGKGHGCDTLLQCEALGCTKEDDKEVGNSL